MVYINFWSVCSISVKYVIGTLIGIALNLYIALDSMAILMMLIIPIHEHGICFHLFVCSFIYSMLSTPKFLLDSFFYFLFSIFLFSIGFYLFFFLFKIIFIFGYFLLIETFSSYLVYHEISSLTVVSLVLWIYL